LTGLDPSDKMERMKKLRGHFNVVLRPEPEGGFTVMVPVLPGCVTYGRTLVEAKKMAKDAISGYIESLKKHGEPIPTDDESLVASLDLEYAETSGR
jgi:antitoxin HicB